MAGKPLLTIDRSMKRHQCRRKRLNKCHVCLTDKICPVGYGLILKIFLCRICQFSFFSLSLFMSLELSLSIYLSIYVSSYQSFYLLVSFLVYSGAGCPRGVMVKAMDCGIVVREFVLQLRYYVHFRANTLGKGMNPQLWVK